MLGSQYSHLGSLKGTSAWTPRWARLGFPEGDAGFTDTPSSEGAGIYIQCQFTYSRVDREVPQCGRQNCPQVNKGVNKGNEGNTGKV